MDTQEIIREAKARFHHQESKLYLQEKYRNKLIFAWGGGLWRVTPGLLGYLANLSGAVVLEDEYSNPVKVDAGELYKICNERYGTTMTEWYDEYTALSRNR